jgi:hypothetical protein
MKPYTYWIYHKPTGMFYFGSRTAKECDPSDLWVKYFTSSKVVKELIENHGKTSFRTKIDRVFLTKEAAIEREYEVLKHFLAGDNDRFLNQHHSRVIDWTDEMKAAASRNRRGKNNGMFRRKHSAESKKKMRKPHDFSKTDTSKMVGMLGKNHTKLTKEKMSKSSRAHSPMWTFSKDDIVFIGCLSDWAEKFQVNKKSAASTFCGGKAYFGWTRKP